MNLMVVLQDLHLSIAFVEMNCFVEFDLFDIYIWVTITARWLE